MIKQDQAFRNVIACVIVLGLMTCRVTAQSAPSSPPKTPAPGPTVPTVAPAVPPPAPAPPPAVNLSQRLVIIAPQSFYPALKKYIDYKMARLVTVFYSLEDALSSASGDDDPERLKRFLYAQWRSNGAGYVLLVGDADIMPVRYMVLDRVTPEAFDYAFYASDLYYGDVAKPNGAYDDWNAQKDGFHRGYIGEVRGEKNKSDPINFDQVDYAPELAVGRWPVNTPEEVSILVEKSIAYETGVISVKKSGMRTAGFLACGGWVDGRDLLDQLATGLSAGWIAEKRYFADERRNDKTPPPDAKEVLGLLNSGTGLIVHIGHGGTDSWNGSFSINDLAAVKNTDRLPIMISAGCSTAVFTSNAPYEGYVDIDGKEHAGTNAKEVFTAPPPPPLCYQRGPHNPTSLGEQLLRHDLNGAVAYIGCNTGGQPCALTLVEGFVNAINQFPRPHLGECWVAAVRHYYEKEKLATIVPNESWYPASVFYQPMKYMVFGDPSLLLPGNIGIQGVMPGAPVKPGATAH